MSMPIQIPDWLVSDKNPPPVPADLYRPEPPGEVFIYGLVDPETSQVRYIGKTRQRLSSRLTAHLQERSRCHRVNWLNALKRKGLRPDIVIFESIEGAWPWQEAERYWIAFGRGQGWSLTNNTSGGDGVPDLPPETRERMRRVWLGRKHTPEAVEKIRRNKTGVIATSETRAKMSAAHRGREILWVEKIRVANRKLSAADVEQIRRRLAGGDGVQKLAAEYAVHRTTLSKIKSGTYGLPGQKAAAE